MACAVVALAVAFYYHFAVSRGYGTPCDAPLLGYIVSVGVLSTVLLLLRTAVRAHLRGQPRRTSSSTTT